MARRANPEAAIQRAVIQHVKARGVRPMVCFAVPNGGWRSAKEAAIMKGTGTLAGMPDLCFIRQGKSFFLELKAVGGRPTEKQLEVMAQLNEAGAFCAVAEGIDAAIAILEAWQLLKGHAA